MIKHRELTVPGVNYIAQSDHSQRNSGINWTTTTTTYALECLVLYATLFWVFNTIKID